MITISALNYNLKKDIEFILSAEKKNIDDLSNNTGISRTTIYEILNNGSTTPPIYEKIYSYIYSIGYRINSVKEDLLKETNTDLILFHGSKSGLNIISPLGSRKNCDFGSGFYLGETYEQALSFVCENEHSSIYSFICNLDNLNVINFNCSLEWMLAICYYRGTIKEFENCDIIKNIIANIEKADVIIAPIADNRMFYIMSLFANGEINADVALHSLSASKLGKQYIFKTEASLKHIVPFEKYYLCKDEKTDCIKKQSQRAFEIDTKLKLAKREFRVGLFIEEVLK